MGNVIDLVVKAANTFYETMSNDENGQFHSWEHCYKCFHDAGLVRFMMMTNLSLQLALSCKHGDVRVLSSFCQKVQGS